MDKTEYQQKLDELQEDLRIKDYGAALELVNTIDWKRVKSVRTLNMVADVYEVNKDYEKCRYVLNLALNRSSIGKSIIYRLAEVCIKQRDLDEAEDYYDQYVKLAPRDNGALLLEFKLARAMKEPLSEQIRILEEYKEREYTEKWSYELARLYSKAGDADKCVEACDDMILWFSEGKYVLKAMELKQQYKPLSASQQAYYDKEQKDSDDTALLNSARLDSYVKPKSEHRSGTILERLDAASAEATKEISSSDTQALPFAEGEMNSMSVTSREFMGGRPNLEAELERSLQGLTQPDKQQEAGGEAKEAGDAGQAGTTEASGAAAQGEQTDEAAGSAGADAAAGAAEAAADAVNIAAEGVGTETAAEQAGSAAEGLEAAGEAAADGEGVKEAEAAVENAENAAEAGKKEIVWDDREIPDPEPTAEEKLSHTIPLGKVGQNTIPISLEEVLKSETPEERRIRILNNAMPTKMSDLQRKVFTYFARIPGMDTQILRAMSEVYEYAGERTSKNGNIAIMGAAGTGKSRLSDGLITAMCADMQLDVAKTARLTGEKMNILDPASVVDRMAGGFLVIENAGDMAPETIEKLNKAMEFRTDCMVLIIEDEKNSMRSLLSKHADFAAKFGDVISIPVFTNDELVAFARTYCAENKFQMDELGVLALYSLISNGQSEENPMTISNVKEILDSAMYKARKGGRRGRKSVNKNKTTVLYEKDFA